MGGFLSVLVAGSVLSMIAGCGGDGGPSPIGGPALQAPDRPPEVAALRIATGSPPKHDLIRATANGQGIRVLGSDSANSPLIVASPAWSPDGSRIAFVASDDPSGFQTDVYTVKAGGSSPERLTDDGRSFEPVWAPDGATIAFARWTPSSNPNRGPVGSTIWTMAGDGSDVRQLTEPADSTYDRPGSFSPTGNTLAFTRYTSLFGNAGPGTINVLDLVSSETRTLADDGVTPAYSPDGELIAFGSSRDHNGDYQFGEDEAGPSYELYVMGTDGSDQRRLTETEGINEVDPSWSSDGAQLAYDRQGNSFAHAVYVTNPDGSCAKPILDGGRTTWYSEPAWRPGSKPGALQCQ